MIVLLLGLKMFGCLCVTGIYCTLRLSCGFLCVVCSDIIGFDCSLGLSFLY